MRNRFFLLHSTTRLVETDSGTWIPFPLDIYAFSCFPYAVNWGGLARSGFLPFFLLLFWPPQSTGLLRWMISKMWWKIKAPWRPFLISSMHPAWRSSGLSRASHKVQRIQTATRAEKVEGWKKTFRSRWKRSEEVERVGLSILWKEVKRGINILRKSEKARQKSCERRRAKQEFFRGP